MTRAFAQVRIIARPLCGKGRPGRSVGGGRERRQAGREALTVLLSPDIS